MKQKSSQMRFAPWPVVQAALALALSGLLLARPQAAAQGFAAGLHEGIPREAQIAPTLVIR